VEKVDATANAVTVSGSIRGAATTIGLVLQHETLELVADASGSWWPVAGHKTKSSLDGTYGLIGLAEHQARYTDVKRSKGGRIGTGGKGVIAWRVDHGIERFLANHWPVLMNAQMPCGIGLVTTSIENPSAVYEPTTTTWQATRLMHYQGAEIWSHSCDHRDPAPLGISTFTIEQQILDSRATLEAQQLFPVGWTNPGITPCLTPNYTSPIDVSQMGTYPGQLLMSAYGLIEADRPAAQGSQARILPTDGAYLLSHVTIDTMTLAAAQAYVDNAITYGVGVEFMFHALWLGTAGYMTMADFTSLVSYVKTKWDAGLIEVLSPSGLAFADPFTSAKLDLLRNGDFENITKVGAAIGAWTATTDAGISLLSTGGHTGTNFVRFSGTTNLLDQPYPYVQEGGFRNAAFAATAWVRNPSASASTARIMVYQSAPGGYGDLGSVRDVRFPLAANQNWTKIRVPFCMPQTANAIAVRIARYDTGSTPGDVDFDDVQCTPI
jgi:hypothetical protein